MRVPGVPNPRDYRETPWSVPEVSVEARNVHRGLLRSRLQTDPSCRDSSLTETGRTTIGVPKPCLGAPKPYQALLKIRSQSQKQGRSLCVPALHLEAFALPSCDLENWGWVLLIKFCLSKAHFRLGRVPISGSPTPFLVCAVYLQFGVVGPGFFEQECSRSFF